MASDDWISFDLEFGKPYKGLFEWRNNEIILDRVKIVVPPKSLGQGGIFGIHIGDGEREGGIRSDALFESLNGKYVEITITVFEFIDSGVRISDDCVRILINDDERNYRTFSMFKLKDYKFYERSLGG